MNAMDPFVLLNQRLEDIQKAVHRIEERVVPRSEYDAHVRETDRRLQALESTKTTAHSEIYSRIASTQESLTQKIDRVSDENDRREADRQSWSRELNTRSWVTVAGAALAFIVAIVTGLIGL